MNRIVFFAMMLVSLVACAPESTPFAATIAPPQAVNVVPTLTPSSTPTITNTPTDTATPTRTATVTPSLTPTDTLTPTPSETLTPSLTPTDTLTPTPSETPTNIFTATPGGDPNDTPPPSWTPPPASDSAISGYSRLRRPISENGVNFADRTYPYGSTSGGRYRTHLGIDMPNPEGTPVLAAADGTVYYAGDDQTAIFGPQPNYYGNLVVIQHGFTSPAGELVYTLYGHMARVDVATGDSVSAGDRLGVVGSEGVAIGPHLHFEVRVGSQPERYTTTRNPELWIFPFSGFGTLAGRVTDSSGMVLRDVTIQIESATGQRITPRYAYSYTDDTVNADTDLQENFTMGDLPANYYDVTIRANGRRVFQQIVYVYPNRTTWLDIEVSD